MAPIYRSSSFLVTVQFTKISIELKNNWSRFPRLSAHFCQAMLPKDAVAEDPSLAVRVAEYMSKSFV